MPTIRPITDLRNTNEISELCHSQQEPVFITKNGYGDLVIMSIAAYEKQLSLLEVCNKLGDAEKQANNGNPNIDGSEVFARLRKKYGQDEDLRRQAIEFVNAIPDNKLIYVINMLNGKKELLDDNTQDVKQHQQSMLETKSAMGVFRKYANPSLISFEKEAWGEAVKEKYANH